MNCHNRTQMQKTSRLALTLVVASAIAAACSVSDRAATTDSQSASALKASPADPENQTQVAAGEQIYQTHCATCHGRKLEGQPSWRTELPGGGYPAPPHDGSGHPRWTLRP